MSESEIAATDVQPAPSTTPPEGLVVVDFSVGPAGVGPPVSISPVVADEIAAAHPPEEPRADG